MPVATLTLSRFSDSIQTILIILTPAIAEGESPPMAQFYVIIALLLATLVAIFAVQNAQEVNIRFLVWTFQSSVVVVILISLGVGALLAALMSLPQMLRGRRRLRESERQLERLAGHIDVSEGSEIPREES
ncbi:MAG: LapA family protein [Candidatus Methylomirabilales bacterium]